MHNYRITQPIKQIDNWNQDVSNIYAMHHCTIETNVDTTHNMSVNLHKNDHSIYKMLSTVHCGKVSGF